MNLITAIMSVLLSASAIALAQDRSGSQTGCALLDKSRSAQFISFESKIETTAKVKLRLHNNTNCSIIVETDDRQPTRLVRLPNGGVKIETVTAPQEGVELPLHYLVQDKQRWRAAEAAYGWGDSVFTYEVPAGQSIVFIVPLTHFQKKLDIAVPFNYAWEGEKPIGMGVGGVIHRVYFLVEDVPEAVLRER